MLPWALNPSIKQFRKKVPQACMVAVRQKVQYKVDLRPKHSSTSFHNCNNYFISFIYRQRFSQCFFFRKIVFSFSCSVRVPFILICTDLGQINFDPFCPLRSRRHGKSRGSNSNAGKIDQTWSGVRYVEQNSNPGLTCLWLTYILCITALVQYNCNCKYFSKNFL